uniref:Major facilitator superfamily (MFS) profile domain-containing protein n=1 Tax=Plectus sambesii TaxID=2011161 RepID=A0A914WD37_9BILA
MVSNGLSIGYRNDFATDKVNEDPPLQFLPLQSSREGKVGQLEMADRDRLTTSDSLTQRESTNNLTGRNSPTPSDDDAPIPRRNYVAVIILFIINLLNYMDRFTVAGVLTQLQDYFDMNDAQGGLLQTVFICFYMIFAPICGYLGDRYNRKWIMSVGIFIWSGAVLLSTFMPSHHYWLFLACRGVVGIGEASYSTVSPTLIADMFTGKNRSRMLMLFYFAIPVGSGLGFIVGSNVATLMGGWQWGVRVTPILGVACLLLIIFVLREPERGEAEGAHVERTTFWEDIKHLAHNRTYVYSTLGFTSVVFVTGSMSWWTPTAVEHAWAMNNHQEKPPMEAKAKISLVFGVITCLAGLLGVAFGSMTAQLWRDGKGCMTRFKNPRADPYICAIGSLAAVPLLFIALQFIPTAIGLGWVFVFCAVTMMCLNWAVIVDMLLYIVVPTRRATASAFQILISHLLGDAASPYVIGLISDKLRGSDPSAAARFYSLQHALYIPNFVLIFSGAFFLIATFFVVGDRRRAKEDMHGMDDNPAHPPAAPDTLETSPVVASPPNVYQTF